MGRAVRFAEATGGQSVSVNVDDIDLENAVDASSPSVRSPEISEIEISGSELASADVSPGSPRSPLNRWSQQGTIERIELAQSESNVGELSMVADAAADAAADGTAPTPPAPASWTARSWR